MLTLSGSAFLSDSKRLLCYAPICSFEGVRQPYPLTLVAIAMTRMLLYTNIQLFSISRREVSVLLII